MIFRNKIRAIVSIPLGLLLSACAGILKVTNPEFTVIADIAIFTGYIIYLWGCLDLVTGKGYSKWLMLLVIVPVVPGLIILLFLRDRNREPRTAAERKATRVAIALTATVCLWMGSIITMRVILDIFVEPVLCKLEQPVHELNLQAARSGGEEFYLMGLKMKFPRELPPVGSVAPYFDNHRLKGMAVLLDDGNGAAGILLDRDTDQLRQERVKEYSPIGRILYNTLFLDNSRFGFVDRMFRARRDDFSWWNPIHDIRQTYLLVVKAIMLPGWHKDASLYRLQTNCLSGYLAKGMSINSKYVTQLLFEDGSNFYNITIIDKQDRDYSDLLSAICVASDAEADRIIDSYAARDVPREIELASRMSRKVTKEYLNEMISLIERRQAAGERTIRDTGDLKSELAQLNTSQP